MISKTFEARVLHGIRPLGEWGDVDITKDEDHSPPIYLVALPNTRLLFDALQNRKERIRLELGKGCVFDLAEAESVSESEPTIVFRFRHTSDTPPF